MKLLPYQIEGVKHLRSGKNRLLLDDMGLGKTAQAVVAFSSLGAKKVLIICPAATKEGWRSEVKRWSRKPYAIQVFRKRLTKLHPKATLVIVNYELLLSPMVYRALRATKWSVMVVDEIHYCSNMASERTKRVLGPANRKPSGIANSAVYCWGLSGTAMTNTPINLWPMLRALGKEALGKYNDWFGFTRRYCQRFKGPWGWDCSGSANVDELRGKMFDSGFALRRTKTEVLKDLPDETYRIVPIDMTKALLLHAERWADAVKKLDGTKELLGMTAGDYAVARREAGEEKVPMVVEYVKELLLTVDKLVIFTWHVAVTEGLGLLLGNYGASLYYGGVTPANKERAKEDFIHGDNRLFIANVMSAGTGLDGLQSVCSHVVLAEMPWRWIDLSQSVSRLHRMGQKSNVLADILLPIGGFEHHVLKVIAKKKEIFQQLLLT